MIHPVKRRYDSSRRRAAAEATGERICAAAERLFLRDGYARTTIREVAREAGVAEATVYLTFSTKPALLNATILRATGAEDGKPLSAILAVPPRAMLSTLANGHAAAMSRAARLIALGESAALMDSDLRPVRDRAHANLRAAYAAIAQRLADAQLLHSDVTVADAADTLYAVCNEMTYLRFTHDGARKATRYAAWLTTTLEARLLHGGNTVSRRRTKAVG
jgi:AcrR family transcriptional regulator